VLATGCEENPRSRKDVNEGWSTLDWIASIKVWSDATDLSNGQAVPYEAAV